MRRDKILRTLRSELFSGYRLAYTTEVERCLPIQYGQDNQGLLQVALIGGRDNEREGIEETSDNLSVV